MFQLSLPAKWKEEVRGYLFKEMSQVGFLSVSLSLSFTRNLLDHEMCCQWKILVYRFSCSFHHLLLSWPLHHHYTDIEAGVHSCLHRSKNPMGAFCCHHIMTSTEKHTHMSLFCFRSVRASTFFYLSFLFLFVITETNSVFPNSLPTHWSLIC